MTDIITFVYDNVQYTLNRHLIAVTEFAPAMTIPANDTGFNGITTPAEIRIVMAVPQVDEAGYTTHLSYKFVGRIAEAINYWLGYYAVEVSVGWYEQRLQDAADDN